MIHWDVVFGFWSVVLTGVVAVAIPVAVVVLLRMALGWLVHRLH